ERDAARHRHGLRDTEVEHLHLARRSDPNVAWFDVAVNDAAVLAILDHTLEIVRLNEYIQNVERNRHCARRLERPACDQFRKVLAFDVLHRDIEVAFTLSDIENLRHTSA